MGQTSYVASDATAQGACKHIQKLQYSNCDKRHALSTPPRTGPRTTGGDLATELHGFPGDFPKFCFKSLAIKASFWKTQRRSRQRPGSATIRRYFKQKKY